MYLLDYFELSIYGVLTIKIENRKSSTGEQIQMLYTSVLLSHLGNYKRRSLRNSDFKHINIQLKYIFLELLIFAQQQIEKKKAWKTGERLRPAMSVVWRIYIYKLWIKKEGPFLLFVSIYFFKHLFWRGCLYSESLLGFICIWLILIWVAHCPQSDLWEPCTPVIHSSFESSGPYLQSGAGNRVSC